GRTQQTTRTLEPASTQSVANAAAKGAEERRTCRGSGRHREAGLGGVEEESSRVRARGALLLRRQRSAFALRRVRRTEAAAWKWCYRERDPTRDQSTREVERDVLATRECRGRHAHASAAEDRTIRGDDSSCHINIRPRGLTPFRGTHPS